MAKSSGFSGRKHTSASKAKISSSVRYQQAVVRAVAQSSALLSGSTPSQNTPIGGTSGTKT